MADERRIYVCPKCKEEGEAPPGQRVMCHCGEQAEEMPESYRMMERLVIMWDENTGQFGLKGPVNRPLTCYMMLERARFEIDYLQTLKRLEGEAAKRGGR